MSYEFDEEILQFHGKKCCWFEKNSSLGFRYALKIIKEYEGEDTTWYGDHVWHSLWQCPDCSAYFLLEEVERIGWTDGIDKITDDYYQVESEEHADKLAQIGGLFARYDGPKMFV